MGVSLCYLRGRSIGAFGWGLLRLLVSDFRMGSTRTWRGKSVYNPWTRKRHPLSLGDGVLLLVMPATTNPRNETRICWSFPFCEDDP